MAFGLKHSFDLLINSDFLCLFRIFLFNIHATSSTSINGSISINISISINSISSIGSTNNVTINMNVNGLRDNSIFEGGFGSRRAMSLTKGCLFASAELGSIHCHY